MRKRLFCLLLTVSLLSGCALFGNRKNTGSTEPAPQEQTEAEVTANTAEKEEKEAAGTESSDRADSTSSNAAADQTVPAESADSGSAEAPAEAEAFAEPEVFAEEVEIEAAEAEEALYAADMAFETAASANMMMAPMAKNTGSMPEPGPLYPIDTPDWNTESYEYAEENRFLSAKTSPFSTFAADVDTASYANVRNKLLKGEPVPADAVRVEEFVNYFHYDLPEPEGSDPFSVTTELADCPWNPDTQLLFIGLQAKKLDPREMPESNLVFLIDVSGSMDEPNKLPLVQRSFRTLAENLNENDRISMVTYSSGEEVILDGITGDHELEITSALDGLYASGSTNGESALKRAYEIAEKNYIEGGNNRIIMATDGDFNVGMSSSELIRFVADKARTEGIDISVLGFGMGNYKDDTLESIADSGSGNYAYIDSVDEARKVLVEEAGGTLFTVAKDVKLQVEFNPSQVKGYRLIGFENRLMAAEDFADDTKDGGEIGAGHQVVALYEIVPIDSDFEIPEVESKYAAESPDNNSAELLTLNIRYKKPGTDSSELLSYPVDRSMYTEEISDNASWAAGAAQAAMLLKGSDYAGTSTFDGIKERLAAISGTWMQDYRTEFLYLLGKMEKNR